MHIYQVRSQDRIGGGGCRTPKSGPFGPKKWTFWTSPPSTLLQRPHFWSTFWPKVDLLPDLGDASHPPNPPSRLRACTYALFEHFLQIFDAFHHHKVKSFRLNITILDFKDSPANFSVIFCGSLLVFITFIIIIFLFFVLIFLFKFFLIL